MNSLQRMLEVLSLFRDDQPVIDIDVISKELGYPASSAYRYVRERAGAGLLVRLPRGYAVGPRIIELDRHMTRFDPVLSVSRDIVDDLVRKTSLDLLISEWYGSKVINILQKSASDTSALDFGRGSPINLFRSATARVVLAYLLPRQLRRLYDQTPPEESGAALGTWKEFSKAMLRIRKDGYCISEHELSPHNSGIAAPIFDEKHRILGSITLAGSSDRFNAFNREFLATLICGAANEIAARIAS